MEYWPLLPPLVLFNPNTIFFLATLLLFVHLVFALFLSHELSIYFKFQP